MKIEFFLKTLLRSIPALLLASGVAAAATVGPGGYTNDLSILPVVSDFATVTNFGASGTVTNAAGLDAAVAALTAESINTALTVSTGSPPAAAFTAVYNETAKTLQLRPTQVQMNLVMATLTNSDRADASSVSISFNLLQSQILGEEVSGIRVYYSLTGLANSWSNVPGLSATAAGLVSANVTLSAPWNVGTPLYLLMADDNGSPSPDTANQIDNFFIGVSGFTVELPVNIVAPPQNLTVSDSHPTTFAVAASGAPTITFQWYRGGDPIASATNASYSIPFTVPDDNGALFSVVAANTLSNVSYSVTSDVVTLTVTADTNPPALAQAQSLGLSHVQVKFSERVTALTATNPGNYSISSTNGGITVFSADLDNNQSSVTLATSPLTEGVTYTVTVNGITDQSLAANAIVANAQINFAASGMNMIVINEIMFNPAVANAEYVELLNISANLTFDLSGWQINGLGYTFPSGSLIAPRAYLVLAKNRAVFATEYGESIQVFDTFNGAFLANGASLTLLKPGTTSAQDVIMDLVRLEGVAPWSTNATGTGSSFQLIDPLQDNSRVGNWFCNYIPGSFTPGTNIPITITPGPFFPGYTNYNLRFVSMTGTVGSTSRLLLNLGDIGEAYIDDLYLANGTNAEAGTNYIVNGDFETQLLGAPALTNFFTSVGTFHSNSTISQTNAHSGTNSLRIVCTNITSFALSRILYKDIPGPTNGQVCTLSFWYRPTFNCTNLFARMQGNTLGHSSIPFAILTPPFTLDSNSPPVTNPAVNIPPVTVLRAVFRTPGAANTNAATLPAFPPLWLNEVQAENLTGPTNSAGQRTAWLELYNAGPNVITLTNLFLSDNFTNLTSWAFPVGATIAPGEFKLIFADGLTGLSTLSELHTSFALPPGGGSLALSRLHNGQPQVIDYLNYTAASDRSYGSYLNGQSFDRQEFLVVTPRAANVTGLNSAPVLAALPGTNVNAGALLSFTASATDADLPAQILTFSLAGQPSGASITSGGLFTWTPAQNQAPGTNIIAVIVADNGAPSLSATQTFTVIVIPPPRSLTISRTNAGEVTLTWQAFAGRSYRVEYIETVDAPGAAWTPLGAPLNATGNTLTFTDTIAPNAQRFYRIRQLQP